ncbi:MAG: hypothetical protein ACE37K_22800 [Planctomycetota bacterium]
MRTFLSVAALASAIAAQSPLTTLFASNNGQAGNMFDLVATNAAGVTVRTFDVSLDPGTWDLEVYVQSTPGSYAPSVNTASAWTLVGSATGVVSAGLDMPTQLPICVETFIPSGTTQAFYVTVTNGSAMNYTNGTTTGALYASSADLEIYEGAGLSYAFLSNFNPRIWNGNIYYDVGDTTGTGCTFADIVEYGAGCGGNDVGDAQYELHSAFDLSDTGHTYIWTGDGYLLLDGAQAFVTPTGAATSFGDDQVQVVPLGFTMPSPHGDISDIALCSNGWLSFDPTVTNADYTETVAEFLSQFPRLAFLWDDLNPSSGGTIHLEAVSSNEFRITFSNVPEYSSTGANTVQVVLFDTGILEVRYGTCSLADALTGVTPGFDAGDLGGIDFSDLVNLGPQLFTTGIAPFSDSMTLSGSLPVLGSAWDLTTANIDPVSPIAITVFGDRSPVSIPMTAIGLHAPGCEIHLATAPTTLTGVANGGVATVTWTLPNLPAFAGTPVSAQSIALSLSNPANLIVSNAVEGTLGN